MIIGVTGDTHNNLNNIKKICTIFNENSVDFVIHTGDISLPKSLLAFNILNCPMIAVIGNNDVLERDDLEEAAKRFDCKIFDEPHFIILNKTRSSIIHHPELIDSKMIDQSDLILHGHTHRFRKEKIGKSLVFNPGECAGFMKDKNQIGIVNLDSLDAKIINF